MHSYIIKAVQAIWFNKLTATIPIQFRSWGKRICRISFKTNVVSRLNMVTFRRNANIRHVKTWWNKIAHIKWIILGKFKPIPLKSFSYYVIKATHFVKRILWQTNSLHHLALKLARFSFVTCKMIVPTENGFNSWNYRICCYGFCLFMYKRIA